MAQTAKKSTGRPKSAPKTAPQAVAKTSTPVIKRNLADDSKKSKVYTIRKGGGIWYKLRQRDITIFDEQAGEVSDCCNMLQMKTLFLQTSNLKTALENKLFLKIKCLLFLTVNLIFQSI